MAIIRCVNIQVEGRHGVYAEEKSRKTLFTVNVELDVPAADRAGASDNLADTVDYARVATIAREVIEGPSRDLLETLAYEILDRIGRECGNVRAARVAVRKPQPAIDLRVEGFEVELSRSYFE